MKKILSFVGLAVAISLSSTNCSKDIEQPQNPSSPAGMPFEISTEISTKTLNEGVATKWTEGDAINLFHAVAGTKDYVCDGQFTLDQSRPGVFVGNLGEKLVDGTAYDWYAIYPYNSERTTPVSKVNLGQVTVFQEGINSTAHLCGNALPLYGVAKGVASDVKPAVTMNNLAAVAAVKVKNITHNVLKVNTVKFTSTENIAGAFSVDITGETVTYTKAGDASSTITLIVNKGEIAANSDATFYIPVKPHSIASGSELTLSVNDYDSTITLDKGVAFNAGSRKSISYKFNEFLKGGQMNDGDEQNWTVLPLVGTKLDESLEAGWAPDFEHMAWTPTFGYTADKPKGGKGACLRLSPEYQLHAYSNNFCMYQEVDVEKDDVLRVSAEMKWGENNNDNGVLFIGFVKEAPKANADQNGIEGITDPDAIIQVYNYWNANNGSIPAFDGNFASAKEVLGGFGCTGDGKKYVEYKVTETGKLYFFFDYRNIWGATWGPRRDILLDNFSIKKVN